MAIGWKTELDGLMVTNICNLCIRQFQEERVSSSHLGHRDRDV